MGKAPTYPESRLMAAAPLQLAADDLALFVLSVGDGDALVLRFPAEGNPPTPSYGVIDSFDGGKSIGLLEDLGAGPIRFMCATHPHKDHIAGLREILVRFTGTVAEFWDSGFRYTGATYRALLDEVVNQAPNVRFVRPTSGYEYFQANAKVTVLSPSIALRNRYDTYGVDINNASIVLRVVYPVETPSTQYPEKKTGKGPSEKKSRTIILGGDAQTDAWGQVLQEFPHLDLDAQNWARQIGAATGSQPLVCDFFKVSHHGSKRGINLELVERLGDDDGGERDSPGPRLMAISSASEGGSTHGFPHLVTQALLREVRDPQAKSGGTHDPDDKLGIHYTAQQVAAGTAAAPGAVIGPAGSIAYVAHADGTDDVYRLMDAEDANVNLALARKVKG